MAEVQGYCDEKFTRVRQVFQKSFDDGYDLGASFALSIEGELIVDLWGGIANKSTGALWQEDTLIPVMSATKTMAALCGLFLVDRGLIDLDQTAP